MSELRGCQRCGSEDALDVQPIRVYEVTGQGETLALCEFCRTIPGARYGDGVAYSVVGNILARIIREGRGP